MTNFSVGQMMTMYSAYPDQKLVQFIPGSNKELTVELYKEEIGKPYSKTDLFLCNVSNVDDAVDRKIVEDKKVSIERSCIGTSPIFKPSNTVADHQNQNANNDEDEFANIFPRYETRKIYSCHLYRYKAQIIYQASYNLRQNIKKNVL